MNIQAKIQKIKTPTYHIKQWMQSRDVKIEFFT